MSLREKINSKTINSKGFVAIGELMKGYVYLQPVGIHMSKIVVVEPNLSKTAVAKLPASIKLKFRIGMRTPMKPEFAKDIRRPLLDKLSKSLNLDPNIKMYPVKNLLEYSKLNQDASIDVKEIINSEFESAFQRGYSSRNRVLFASNSRVKVSLESDFVYKFLDFKSPYSDTKFSILFQSSRYLENEKDLWKLVVILGEKFFIQKLAANHNIVNEMFINDSFSHSGQFFYISKENRKVFSTINERITQRNADLEKISLFSILELENADVNLVEEVLEKGDKKF